MEPSASRLLDVTRVQRVETGPVRPCLSRSFRTVHTYGMVTGAERSWLPTSAAKETTERMTTSITSTAPPRQRMPIVVPLPALGTFLMITTEYLVAGLLQELAGDLQVGLAHVGLLITAAAVV